MSDNVIEEIELDIKEAREFIALNDSLERLKKNRDFKKLIMEDYFREESVRLVHLRSHPNMQSDESQDLINKQINGIGALITYLRAVGYQADQAARAIDAGEEALEEIHGEGVAA